MTDGSLMDADCIHNKAWYECEACTERFQSFTDFVAQVRAAQDEINKGE